MFGIGTPELILLMVFALIIFGPQRLPEIAGQIGKAIRDFRQMSADVTSEFSRTMTLDAPPSEATLDPQPVLGGESIGAQGMPVESGFVVPTATSEGARTNGTESAPGSGGIALATETIPVEPSFATTTGDAAPADILLATRDDPHAAVSLLDEDGVVKMLDQPAPDGTDEVVTFRPQAEPIPTVVPDEGGTLAPVGGASDHAVASNGDGSYASAPIYSSTDAWESVLTTEVTAPPPVPAEPVQPTLGTTTRLAVDPSAEVTIREKIEAQIAAEAFRERRRRASYDRARRKQA